MHIAYALCTKHYAYACAHLLYTQKTVLWFCVIILVHADRHSDKITIELFLHQQETYFYIWYQSICLFSIGFVYLLSWLGDLSFHPIKQSKYRWSEASSTWQWPVLDCIDQVLQFLLLQTDIGLVTGLIQVLGQVWDDLQQLNHHLVHLLPKLILLPPNKIIFLVAVSVKLKLNDSRVGTRCFP